MSTRALLLVLMSLAAACSEPPDCPACPSCPPPADAPREPPAAADVSEPTAEHHDGALDSPAPPTAGPAAHTFARVAYPRVDGAFGRGTRLEFDFFALSLRIVANGIEDDVLAGLEVRMHLPDGRVVTPADDPFPNALGGHGLPGPRTTWLRNVAFAWQGNNLDEAWVSVDLAAHGRYWLELPYGVVRDPEAPLPDADTRTGPRYAPAMRELTARDHVVPFRHVRYDVGELGDGWQLAALVSNPFDAHVELELYRDDGGVGKSAYRWSLDEAPTSATFVTHNGHRLSSMRMLTRLHEDGLRRSDHFTFPRRTHGRRGWGTLEVHVGDEVRAIRVPSSLYLYTHGTADPYDERRTVNAASVLGPWLF